VASNFNARDASVYERSMGRWSRRLAPGFLRFAALGAPSRALDVGCGTGSLLDVLAEIPELDELQGIDASEIYAAAATARFNGDARVRVRQGDAEALPFADGIFDAALSQLVLQFVADPAAALAEMRRVVRPGGTVAAAVWNSGGGMPHQRMFWDTAAMLDPTAATLRARTFRRPMTRRGDLKTGFTRAGLLDVEEAEVTIWMEFENFQDFWKPIDDGEGTLGKYVGTLGAAEKDRLAAHLRDAYEAGQEGSGGCALAEQSAAFACTAAVCRGRVPAASEGSLMNALPGA